MANMASGEDKGIKLRMVQEGAVPPLIYMCIVGNGDTDEDAAASLDTGDSKGENKAASGFNDVRVLHLILPVLARLQSFLTITG